MAGILAPYRHVNDGTHGMAADIWYAQLFHQLVVSGGNLCSVYMGNDAASADLTNSRNPGTVDFFSVCLLQAAADRMGRGAFGKRRVLHQLFRIHAAVMDLIDFKHPLGQRTGLIKNDDSRLRQNFQIVRAFDQNSGFAGAADAGKKAERDADDQGAWTLMTRKVSAR